jgi:Endoribonuclease L-PSP/Amidohydrolase
MVLYLLPVRLPIARDGVKLVDAPFEQQAQQTLNNIAAALKAAGSTIDRLVQVWVYVTDIALWPAFNAIYATYIRRRVRPAQSCWCRSCIRLQDRNRGGCVGRLVMTLPKVIALEEHLTLAKLRALRGEKDTPVQRKLDDLGELRIREMDEAEIDLQVISENNPATQNLDAETAVELARAYNNVLYEAVRRHPDRFAGFATLPTPDPKAAATSSSAP